MKVRTLAPAKINWTLEVLGKRDDGYHEIKSVMQTIDLSDEVEVEASDRTTLVAEGYEPDEDDLALRAVRALEETVGRELPVTIRLVKRIPVAAGLGGGSSDAAAVLRAVDRLYDLGLSREDLAAVGAKIGSDVPFFCYGGTALVEGRGERVLALPDVAATWMVVVMPNYSGLGYPTTDKTKSMYQLITPHDYSDGNFTQELVALVRDGWLPEQSLRAVRRKSIGKSYRVNAFATYMGPPNWLESELLEALDRGIDVTGSGPGLYGFVDSEKAAYASVRTLMRKIERIRSAQPYAARTLGAEDATRVWVDGEAGG